MVSWISFGCFFIAAILHFYFFIYEFFLFSKPNSPSRKFNSEEQMAVMIPFMKNQAVYNLGLCLGTLFGLYNIFKMQIMVAGALVTLCGATMLVAGITLWITYPRLRRAALLQIVPPFVGFIFLAFHVIERISAAP